MKSRRSPARRRAYSQKRHDIASHGPRVQNLQLPTVLSDDLGSAFEAGHRHVRVVMDRAIAPETELERRTRDGDR